MKKLAYLFFALSICLNIHAQSSSPSLVACYALDGNANDPISSLNGTLSSVTSTANRFNNANSAYYFSGNSSSFIQLPNNSLLKPTNAISFSAWIKVSVLPTGTVVGNYILFTKNAAFSNFEAYSLVTYNAGGSGTKFRAIKGDGSGGVTVADGTTSIAANTWYHVAFTIDNTQIKIYINGVLEATSSLSYGFSYDTSKFVYFGGTNDFYNLPFQGTIDNARFYSGILSASDVSLLYTSDPNCTNSPGLALNCDGTNDYADPNVLVNSFSNNFTIETWARPTATHEIDPESTNSIDGISGQKYLLWPTWRNTEGGIGISVGTNGVSVYEHGNNFIPSLLTWTGTINAWTHLAVVVTNKQPSLYVNGVLVKTGQTSIRTNVWPSLGMGSTFSGQLGGIGGGTYGYYEGDVDEFRLWNSARTQTQIASTMNSEFICPPTGLVAYYKFNQGLAFANNSTVTSATDFSGNNYTASLNNFTLAGNTSNWVAPGATLTPASLISVSATPSSTSICPGQNLTLSATGATTYTWLPFNTSGSLITVSPTASIVYTVIGQTGSCTGSAVVTVSVQPLVISATSSTNAICPGAPAILSAGGASTYTWQPVNLTGASITVNPSASIMYTVTGTNGACTASTTVPLTVFGNPSLFITTTQSIVCAGYVVGLDAIGAQATYSWQPVNLSGASISPTVNATTIFTVTATSPQGCITNSTVLVTVTSCTIPPIDCNSTFYSFSPSTNDFHVIASNMGIPNTSTVLSTILPYGALGLAVGSSFGFTTAPNPTFWTTVAGKYWYHNGSSFVNSGHTSLGWNLAGSRNYIYSLGTAGEIYRYDGTANATGIATLTALSFQSFFDIAADDLDNFYVATYSSLSAFNSSATALCSYSHSSITSISGNFAGGLAIIGNSVALSNGVAGNLNIGTFSGSALNFTSTAFTGGWDDFASCPLPTAFSSTISANPNPTVSCFIPTITLSVADSQPIGPAISYTWSGPGLVTSVNAQTIIVNAPGVYTCSLRSCPGGTSIATFTVINHLINPVITLTSSTPSLCAGGVATLTANNALTYTWQPSNISVNTITVSPSSSFVYSASGTNTFGCSSTSTIQITVFQNPIVTISPGSPTTCSGSSATLTAGGGASYVWSPGSINAPSISVTPANTSTYFVTGTSSNNCSGTSSVIVTVIANPTLIPIPNFPAVCAGSSDLLFVTGATSYTWLPVNLSGSIVSVSPSVTSIYTVVGASNGCTASATVAVIVEQYPVLNPVASPSANCPGYPITLSPGATGNATWQPGNVFGNPATVNPLSTTIYSVTLASGGVPCATSGTLLVTINNCTLPVLSCNTDFYSMNANSTNIYATSNLSNTPTTYSAVLPPASNGLAIGPAFGFTAPNPTYWTTSGGTYWYHNGTSFINTGHSTGNSLALSPGGSKNFIYNVTPTGQVYKYNGTGTSSFVTTIALGIGMVSDVVGDDQDNFYVQHCCGGSSIKIYNAAGSLICSYSSSNVVHSTDYEGGLAILNNTVVVQQTGGQYQWSGLFSNSPIAYSTFTLNGGISDYASCPVVTAFSSSISAFPTSTITCYSPTTSLNVSGQNIASSSLSYTWAGPGITSSQNSQTLQAASAGIYTCYLSSCPGGTSMATFTVYNNPNLNLTIAGPGNGICEGSAVTMTASGATIYTWTPSAGLSSTVGPIITASPGVTTTYTLTGINNACVGTTVVTVIIFPKPVLTVSPVNTVICSGNAVFLNAQASVPSSLTWLPGNLPGNSVSVTPASNTIYTIQALSSQGCSSTETINITVNPLPSLFLASSGTAICSGFSATLIASGASGYTWTPGAIANSSLIVSPNITTTYSLVAENNYGCRSTGSITINVSPTPTLLANISPGNICAGSSALLSANGAASYTWQPGNLTGGSVSVNPPSTTSYTVTGRSVSGCMATSVTSLIVTPSVVVTISSSADTVCIGNPVTLTAAGANTYTWMPGNQTGSSIIISPATPSIYTVLGSNGNCYDTSRIIIRPIDCTNRRIFGLTNAASQPIPFNSNYYRVNFTVIAANISNSNLSNVLLNSNLKNTFPYPCSYSVIAGPEIKSINSALLANSLFDGDSQLSLTAFSSILLPNRQDTLVYSVLVEPKGFYGPAKNSVVGFAILPNHDAVSDSSNNGFVWDPDHDGDPTNNNEITIIDISLISLFIPEGFSPDGDGINEQLVIKGLNGRSAKFTIYNRWGNKVYAQEGSEINWDGKANTAFTLGNGKVPEATYYYTLEFLDGDKRVVTGFVVVQY